MPWQMSYVGNLLFDPDGSKGPLIRKGLFTTGTAIEKGEVIERTATTQTVWVPWDSDFDIAASSPGDYVAFAWEDIATGDRSGYYKIAVPRPGDVWSMPLATAAATAIGAPLYYSSSKALAASGTYIFGNAVGEDHYPDFQGHVSKDASFDAGTTVASQTDVLFTVQLSNSPWEEFQTA